MKYRGNRRKTAKISSYDTHESTVAEREGTAHYIDMLIGEKYSTWVYDHFRNILQRHLTELDIVRIDLSMPSQVLEKYRKCTQLLNELKSANSSDIVDFLEYSLKSMRRILLVPIGVTISTTYIASRRDSGLVLLDNYFSYVMRRVLEEFSSMIPGIARRLGSVHIYTIDTDHESARAYALMSLLYESSQCITYRRVLRKLVEECTMLREYYRKLGFSMNLLRRLLKL
ncbi:MAG: hypothetical protein GXO26_08980 [Crenarchaeota archaeon]|nr:hypothetical protein [Thermoproteota archaeon]